MREDGCKAHFFLPNPVCMVRSSTLSLFWDGNTPVNPLWKKKLLLTVVAFPEVFVSVALAGRLTWGPCYAQCCVTSEPEQFWLVLAGSDSTSPVCICTS